MAGLGTITDCFFINNNTESVELVGINTKSTYNKSDCFSYFFVGNSWELNRANVTTLRTGAISGSSLNERLYKSFKNLRVLDITNFGVTYLTSEALNLKLLEKLIAAHNNMTNISEWTFFNVPNITEIDFSFNKITTLYASNFRRAPKLKVINLSNNRIYNLGPETFRGLFNLRILDLSYNLVSTIDKNQFNANNSLESLRLESNPIIRIDCEVISFMVLTSVNISLNNVTKIDTSCLTDSVQLDLENKSQVIFRVAKSNSELHCSREHFKNLNQLNIAGNKLNNTVQVIELLGSSLESLNISSNSIGKLTSKTFKMLNNLLHLNLSRSNLSNFGFKSFFHQTKLKSLDISYNSLKKVNFTLLLRNFRNLSILNLEGNNLTEINTVTHFNFPALTTLGISKNHFTCDYLATFLRPWDSLQLFHNPSDETHIDGVDCYHYDERDDLEAAEVLTTEMIDNDDDMIEVTEIEVMVTPTKTRKDSSIDRGFENEFPQSQTVASTDSDYFRIFERILLVVCLACCGFLLLKKSKAMAEIKQRLQRISLERNVSYQHDDYNSENNLSLIDPRSTIL